MVNKLVIILPQILRYDLFSYIYNYIVKKNPMLNLLKLGIFFFYISI